MNTDSNDVNRRRQTSMDIVRIKERHEVIEGSIFTGNVKVRYDGTELLIESKSGGTSIQVRLSKLEIAAILLAIKDTASRECVT